MVKFSEEVIVLLNGNFPTHSLPLSYLSSSKTIICADGAANKAIENSITPDYIIGDMDSLKQNNISKNVILLKDEDQNSTDLEKILNWSIRNRIKEITLLGISGEMEDHSYMNLHIMAHFSDRITIKAVTDHFTILHLKNLNKIKCKKNSRISIVKAHDNPIINTKGLFYEIINEHLNLPSQGLSNKSTSDSFTINIKEGSIFLFIEN